jgi:uncharacterized protein with PIN domain
MMCPYCDNVKTAKLGPERSEMDTPMTEIVTTFWQCPTCERVFVLKEVRLVPTSRG